MQSSHPRSVHHVARRAIARCMQASKPSLLSFPRPANTRSSQRSHRSFLAAHALPFMPAQLFFYFHCFAPEFTNGYATHGLRKIKRPALLGAARGGFGAPRPRFPMNGGCVNRAPRLALGAPYTQRPRGDGQASTSTPCTARCSTDGEKGNGSVCACAGLVASIDMKAVASSMWNSLPPPLSLSTFAAFLAFSRQPRQFSLSSPYFAGPGTEQRGSALLRLSLAQHRRRGSVRSFLLLLLLCAWSAAAGVVAPRARRGPAHMHVVENSHRLPPLLLLALPTLTSAVTLLRPPPGKRWRRGCSPRTSR